MSLRQEAMDAHRLDKLQDAKVLYKRLIESNRHEAVDFGNLGAILVREGKYSDALAVYKTGLAEYPDNRQLLLNLSNCWEKKGNIRMAAKVLEQVWVSGLQDLVTTKQLARLLMKSGQEENAQNIMRAFCIENAEEPRGWLELGVVQSHLGALSDAIESFTKGREADKSDPRFAANILTTYGEMREFDKAKVVFKNLHKCEADNWMVKGAWAGVLMNRGKHLEAEALLEVICADNRANKTQWINLSASRRMLRKNNRSMKVLKEAICRFPGEKDLENAYAQGLSETGKPLQAVRLLNRLAKEVTEWDARYLFNYQFIGSACRLIKPAELRYEARKWEKEVVRLGIGEDLWADLVREPLGGRKIRIGYLSSDFCNHPVTRFLLPVVKAHNKETVETVGISAGRIIDRLTREVEKEFGEWYNVSEQNDASVSRLISDLKLDALVELGGFTGNSKLAVLASKPAPVQVSYLGYFAPTYLKCIDGWIGDKILFSKLSMEESSAHKKLYIDKGYMAFEMPARDIAVREIGDSFRFGSFNNSRKLLPEVIKTYSEILNRVVESELVLKSVSFIEQEEKDRVLMMLLKCGCDIERVHLLEWREDADEHLGMYGKVDLCLDPFPYGGATTTAEALCMGVPVITLAGEGMVGQLSSSILSSVDCSEWICESKDEYIDAAVSFAKKGIWNDQDRRLLRKRVERSAFMDGKRVADGIERELRRLREAIRC